MPHAPRVRRPRRTVPPVPTARVLVLSATVGRGHEGAAHELARRLHQRGVDTEVRDFLDALPAVARRTLRNGYQPVVDRVPWLFDRLFDGLERPGSLHRTGELLCRAAGPAVRDWARGADVVVSTYPLASQTLGQLRRQETLTVPAVTFLTDPAAHRLWCHPDVDHHLTVTRATADDGGRYGVGMQPVGALCAPRFSRGVPAAARRRLRTELGLPSGAPVVLVSAGSLGIGQVPATVRAVLRHRSARVLVLCGRNRTLRRRLAGQPRVVALDWRDDVPELMAVADVLVHNAGGLSFTEALVAGLPAVTYLPIPGHGRANADLLARADLAPWPRGPEDLVAAIDEALARPRPGPGPRPAPELPDAAAVVAALAARQAAAGRAGPPVRERVTTAVLAALAALCTGAAGAAQHHATHQVARRAALHPGLVLALLRRPWWLIKSLTSGVGAALQTTALALGSIVVVQTVMLSSLGWAAVAESLLARRRPGRRVVAGVALAVAGVVGCVVLLAPRLPAEPTSPTAAAVGVVAAGCALLAVAGAGWAARGGALGLAVVTGVGYGLTAALLKLVGAQVRVGGWVEPVGHPAVYVVAVLGPAAVLLSQNALQRGRPATAALTIVLLLDPLVGVAAGVLWFGERLDTAPGALAGAAACVAAAVAGAVVSRESTGGGPAGARPSAVPRRQANSA